MEKTLFECECMSAENLKINSTGANEETPQKSDLEAKKQELTASALRILGHGGEGV